MLDIKFNLVQFIALTFSLFLPNVVFSQTSPECTLEATSIFDGTSLYRSWQGTTFDGGGGIDTFKLTGNSITFTPRAKRFISLEVLDIKNDMFTTVIVDAEMILSTERDEIEVVTDWFDQVILDPRYDWSATVDHVFTGRLFTTMHDGRKLTVRTGLHTHVINEPGPGLAVQEGPIDSQGKIWNIEHLTPKINKVKPKISTLPSNEYDASLQWDSDGVVIPDLTTIPENAQTIELNTKNDVQNAVVIDLKLAIGKTPRDLMFQADPFDRLILVQEPCWDISDVDSDGQRKALAIRSLPQRLSITANARHLQDGRTGSFTWAKVSAPGYRHLSVEAPNFLDAIRLQNGGPDVLIIRNTLQLRRDTPIHIQGDSGLDKVWLEGSAGWKTEFRDNGIVATVPTDNGSQIELHFSAGIEFKILPIPKFLNNPALLEQPFYPGSPDQETKHEGLYVTRGGYVGLSVNQLANKRRVHFINGAANFVRISPEQISRSADNLELYGELGLDTLLIDDMPEYEIDDSGAIIWQIDRPDGNKQRVKASGFAYAIHPTQIKN